MAGKITGNNPAASNLYKDQEILAIRQQTYSKLKWGPVLSSASQFMGMFGGPLLSAGLLALVGFGVLTGTAIAITLIGAVLSMGSIAANYIGNRISQDAYLDQTDVGARSNARYIVQEFKANDLCVTTHEHAHNMRADGKKWGDVVTPQEPSDPTRLH